jgi:single-stranded-DNA-specific exonuclease
MVVDLLTTASPEKAADLVRYLEKQNEDRQKLERRIFSEANEVVEMEGHQRRPALVLASPEWHAGIIGIVASRLVDRYARPVLLIALRRERVEESLPSPDCLPTIGQGSGRSVPGFALHEALRACGADLLSYGGHRAAAGFRIRPERIDAFREHFCAYTAAHFPDGLPPATLELDAEVPLAALTFGLMQELDRLEPYGAGNPRPLFLAGGLEVIGTPRRIGQGERHLSFRVRQGGTQMRAVAWGMGERLEEVLSQGGRCCVVFVPRVNEWQGYRSVELEVVDFQPGGRAALT